ncbi:MAG: TIGR00341 family protein [Syntrophomonadaceae bacterium]|nr:TIGR00341 family protein [Syntrophomonadaceae bacterium]MDD3890008.1 TIGR00341 family protein [Syntrophomonadaceae bacterium]MDD4550084.1 TIGR00341 family protein [Syntrophomonadaceae bacterium]
MLTDLWKKLHLKLFYEMTPADRTRVYTEIATISTPSRTFYLLACISTIIAAYGLLANSTAVVIGAMLIAPLMGPIFGIALGLSNGDNNLLKNSLISELQGMLLAIGLAIIIGMIPLRPDFGSEIIARTQPTIYDVIIALASGVAGAYAMVNKRIGPALPGVAISTAIVPPLATVGLCISIGNWDWALGAFLLFLVNLLAIEFAAAAVYAISGLVKLDRPEGLETFFRRFGLSLVILLIMGIFMTQTLGRIVTERTLAEKVREVISEQVRTTVGARLSEVRYERQDGTLQVMAVVLTPQEFDSQRVADIESVLQQEVEPNTRLVVRSLLSRDADRNGQVFIAEEERLMQTRLAEENMFLGNVSRMLTTELGKVPGTRVVEIQPDPINENGERNITAVVHTPTPINPLQVEELEEQLNNSLEVPIRLKVRSLLTRDADNKQYIYEDSTWHKPLKGPELVFHETLELTIKNQLYNQEPAAQLLELYYGEKDEDLLVLMQIRAPYSFGPDEVNEMETTLQKQVDERIKVIIRTQVGADASADWYLSGYDENLAKVLVP